MRCLLVSLVAALALGCGGAKGTSTEGSAPVKDTSNPLLAEWETPFGVPPFSQIDDEHFPPAFEAAIAAHQAEVDALAGSEEPPTFENTVAALDYSGQLLERVANVFFPKNSADTNDRIQEIAKEVAPELSAHRDGIMMNAVLFARVKAVHDARDGLDLSPEQLRLLEETYKDFVSGGAELGEKDKARLTEINQRLSVLSLQFGENLLEENNRFKLVIEKEEELSGLPETSIAAAADAAREADLEGKWVFTLHKPSWIPFLQFSDRRDYREQMFEGYIERGNHGDDLDNKEILAEMVALRIERAKLLGHATHAHYVLERNMAKTPDKVYELLNQLWKAALEVTKAEAAALQEMLGKEIPGAELEPWDWWYYTEKLREQKYDLSDEELRPYFKLENVQSGAFEIATKLFGLTFEPRDDLPLYHEEARVVEVKNADGSHLGILYLDYHPRASKRQGAWMTEYRGQQVRDGEPVTPVVVNVFNFTRATDDTPALLSLEEVETLFHEFGHGLHGLLSNVTYPGLAGTNVARDFVELPSQFMENWAVEPSVLKTYALHYETGEPIPDELIDKIIESRHFNQGFETTEYLAASFLDMDWHTLKEDPGEIDVLAFEEKSLDGIGLIEDIVSRYRSTYFAHIFAGGYSSGYYSYIWSAVLDSDAFAAFKEKDDLFDAETARKYREFVLSAGNTADPMELYVKFRGKEPSIEPLLEKRGLK
jgi:peptidyl-dipeptidase Dcp